MKLDKRAQEAYKRFINFKIEDNPLCPICRRKVLGKCIHTGDEIRRFLKDKYNDLLLRADRKYRRKTQS